MKSASLRRLAFGLLIAPVLYNVIEGFIALSAGIRAGCLVLLTFGADSYLDVLAAGAVIWRLTYENEEAGERAEQRAMRLAGWTFLLLAGAVVFQSLALANGDGLALLVASLIIMPVLAPNSGPRPSSICRSSRQKQRRHSLAHI